MPTYIAFLRAINLGAKRKFPKDAIIAATESAGGADVATYINTGNVRLDSRRRSVRAVARDLEAAYLADRGWEVPTIVFTPSELVEVAATADALWAEHGEPETHYITLLAEPPSAAAINALQPAEGEQVVVAGRAAHVLLQKNFHEGKVLTSKPFAALGIGTARNVTVVRELARRWCGA